ncbi:unnamed protein product [Rotaria magnacalcarata]|uniref:Translation initiation factor 2 gamma subunit n=1 Tax=Rotaria magnacalcarata TaxID=392030 RepID=A0A819LIT9_9BILA|nr:unnamed protein product [Rotaria magnacalcarata]
MKSSETLNQTIMANKSIANLNLNLLTPLTPEIMSRQATINIGTIGHVAHGKSTVVKSLSGIDTGKFGREKQQNMTIKLGYANAKILNNSAGISSVPEALLFAMHSKAHLISLSKMSGSSSIVEPSFSSRL